MSIGWVENRGGQVSGVKKSGGGLSEPALIIKFFLQQHLAKKKSVRVFSKEDRRTGGSLIFTCTRVYFSETYLAILHMITVFAKVIYDVRILRMRYINKPFCSFTTIIAFNNIFRFHVKFFFFTPHKIKLCLKWWRRQKKGVRGWGGRGNIYLS